MMFKAIVRVARHANITPYNADKIFWLVCSGRFYEDLQIGEKGKIGSRTKAFIVHVKEQLSR